MRERAILLASVGLNLGLAAALFWHSPPVTPPAEPPSTNAPAPPPAVKTRVLVRKQFFTWSEIETNDYAAYISNLREIECPEPTIRDIIVSEINLLYAKRRAKEVPSLARQWWRSQPDPEYVRAATEKLNALEAERVSLLDKLLGPGWEATMPETQIPVVDLYGPNLDDLAPDARKAVEQIAKSAQTREDAYMQACQKEGTAPDAAELARLQQEARSQLAQYLNATQLQEYLLRYSPLADKLRSQLTGFEATPEEFQKIFNNADSLEQVLLATPSGDDANARNLRASMQQQSEVALKQTLGEDRYKTYQLTTDPAFAQARQITEQYGAPADAIEPIYQINQLLQAELQKIKNDPNLSDDERALAILQAQSDEEKSIQSVIAAKIVQKKPGTNEGGPPMPGNP